VCALWQIIEGMFGVIMQCNGKLVWHVFFLRNGLVFYY
jgi:hypothetical protein